jgi:CRP/FNR family transcriptional regulator, cyclic AMP receptor protein
LTARVVDTTTLTVPERVRAKIVRQARLAGVVVNKSTINGFPTHADLASQIGATREAVSRELSRLSGQGLIRREGWDLTVTDFNELIGVMTDRT